MTLNEIKRHLQDHFCDGLLVIVGSGLSCAEGLPGMYELANHLIATVGEGLPESDKALWDEIIPMLTAKGLEAALLEKTPTLTLETAISNAISSLIVTRERKIVSDIFNNGRQLRFTRLLTHLLKPTAGLPIITTNYDRLIEIAVEEAGIGVDTMFVGKFAASLNPRESQLSFCKNVTLKNRQPRLEYRIRASVYKPHGSLDWYLRDGNPVAYTGDLDDVPRLIITPGHNKFRNGYESPFDRHRDKANEAIDKARRFLILGYGFNDDHLETHLSPAIRSGRPTLMLAHTLSINALKLATEHPNVTALEAFNESSEAGTRLTINRTHQFLPRLTIWDVHNFIEEILEP